MDHIPFRGAKVPPELVIGRRRQPGPLKHPRSYTQLSGGWIILLRQTGPLDPITVAWGGETIVCDTLSISHYD
jgi:hypothetical protein